MINPDVILKNICERMGVPEAAVRNPRVNGATIVAARVAWLQTLRNSGLAILRVADQTGIPRTTVRRLTVKPKVPIQKREDYGMPGPAAGVNPEAAWASLEGEWL